MSLYDPGEFPTETVTSPDFTLADVLAWARTKPADEEYIFIDSSNCAVAQFGRATGRPYLIGINDPAEVCRKLGRAANHEDQTFGAFADRLEKALS